MKQLAIITFFGMITINGFSQYKKASFFNKEGRVYEICGGASHMGSTGGGITPSVFYAATMETSKKLNLVSEIGVQFKSDFSYSGQYLNTGGGAPVNTAFKGKTPIYLMVKYGVRYRFIASAGESDKQLVPYVKLAFAGMYALSDQFTFTKANGEVIPGYDASPAPVPTELNIGLEGAGGVYYYFTEKLGVKAELGYRRFVNARKMFGNYDSNVFNPVKNYPTLSIGLKIKISTGE